MKKSQSKSVQTTDMQEDKLLNLKEVHKVKEVGITNSWNQGKKQRETQNQKLELKVAKRFPKRKKKSKLKNKLMLKISKKKKKKN